MPKFELEPYHRNVPDKELIADLKRVATKINKQDVTVKEYDNYGKYHSCTLQRKFGSWLNVIEKAGLCKIHKRGISEEEYFNNLRDVWIKLGRQPRHNDIQKPLSKYSNRAYVYRFGTWRKALEKFIEYINKEEVLPDSAKPYTNEALSSQQAAKEQAEVIPVFKKHKVASIKPLDGHKTKRTVSERLRFLVMRRDNFKCQECGWSPAKDTGNRILVIDHNKAWSKDGETTFDNLQTLCSVCNGGKSNL